MLQQVHVFTTESQTIKKLENVKQLTDSHKRTD